MTAGRPQEYDRIKIGQDMVKWATGNPEALTVPMFAVSIGMHSGILRTWSVEDPKFRALYIQAKEQIGINRLKCTQDNSNFVISDSLYSKTLHYYDFDIKGDIREEKEFDASLANKESVAYNAEDKAKLDNINNQLSTMSEALKSSRTNNIKEM